MFMRTNLVGPFKWNPPRQKQRSRSPRADGTNPRKVGRGSKEKWEEMKRNIPLLRPSCPRSYSFVTKVLGTHPQLGSYALSNRNCLLKHAILNSELSSSKTSMSHVGANKNASGLPYSFYALFSSGFLAQSISDGDGKNVPHLLSSLPYSRRVDGVIQPRSSIGPFLEGKYYY